MGFGMKSAQQTVNNTVNFIFFRQRHRAQTECDRILGAVYKTSSPIELTNLIVIDAAKAFGLASAALFTRLDDGGFVRDAAIGWPAGTTWHLLPGDPLAARVLEARGVATLGEFGTSEQGLPSGLAHPAIGLSLRKGRDTVAFVLYGAHESGAMLDPQEIGSLKKLVQAANTVYAGLVSAGTISELQRHAYT
jgi:hypothetical protein